jgi:hypothetical protein
LSMRLLVLAVLLILTSVPVRSRPSEEPPSCTEDQTSGYALQYCAQVKAQEMMLQVQSSFAASPSSQWSEGVKAVCFDLIRPLLNTTGWKTLSAECEYRLHQALMREFTELQAITGLYNDAKSD